MAAAGRGSRGTARRSAPPPRKPSSPLLPLLVAGGIVVVAGLSVAVLATRKPPAAPPPKPAPAAAAKPAPAPEPPPVPKKVEPAAAPDDEKARFESRLAARREAAKKEFARAREALDQDRKEAAELKRERDARLALKPVAFALASGEKIAGAVILDFSVHDVEIRTADGARRLTWDAVAPASVLQAADALFDPDQAARQFERGRFLIARRMWAEARKAFERAAALGAEYADKADELKGLLERVLSAEGVGRGRARRAGPDQLRLAYDFRDDAQLADFTPGLVRKGEEAVFEAKEDAELFLTGGAADDPIRFEENLALEMRFAAEAPIVIQFLASDRGAYELDFGTGGAVLARIDEGAPPRVLARSPARLVPGKVTQLRLQARERRFHLHVDGAPALSAQDLPSSPDEPRRQGVVGLGIRRGRLRLLAPFVVQGRVREGEIEKRVGESEVLLRRALDEDLARIGRRRAEAALGALGDEPRSRALSADDPWFSFRIQSNDDLMKYEDLKKSILGFLEGSRARRGDLDFAAAAAELEKLAAKHPDVPALHYLRACVGCERQQHAGVRRDVARALELFPDFAEALILDSRLRMEEGDLEGALRSADRAVALRPDHAPAYVQRALARFASPGRGAWQDDLDLAVELDPAGESPASTRRVLRLQDRGPRELGCRFDHETEHFRITTDISAEAARRYGVLLEAAFGHFAGAMRAFYRPSAGPKPRVAVFQTAENYYTYFELLSESRGEYTLGVFRRQFNELVLFESLDAERTVHTLLHESFHYFTTLLMPDTPPYWWNEGMAEYMGALEIRDGKVVRTGLILNERLWLLRFFLRMDRTVPFERIMNETPREFYGPEAMLRYAQAWSMIHFLHEHANGRHRPLLDRYFAALKERKPPREAYEEAFAPSVLELERDWKAFAKKLKLDGEK